MKKDSIPTLAEILREWPGDLVSLWAECPERESPKQFQARVLVDIGHYLDLAFHAGKSAGIQEAADIFGECFDEAMRNTPGKGRIQ